jgi:large subunit ribosomal protein L23
VSRAVHPYQVLLRPIITEKATMLTGENKYAFEVDRRVNKLQIKEAVEAAFDVHVTAVNVMNVKGKRRRVGRRSAGKSPDWKKAIVTLAEGDKIQVFEGV